MQLQGHTWITSDFFQPFSAYFQENIEPWRPGQAAQGWAVVGRAQSRLYYMVPAALMTLLSPYRGRGNITRPDTSGGPPTNHSSPPGAGSNHGAD